MAPKEFVVDVFYFALKNDLVFIDRKDIFLFIYNKLCIQLSMEL
jgi:hypothetical protein